MTIGRPSATARATLLWNEPVPMVVTPVPGVAGSVQAASDLDPPAQRAVARRLAEESVILLANPVAALPLAKAAKVAVVGPLADEPLAFFGCYSMPRHLGHLNTAADGPGVEVATLLDALRQEGADVTYEPGCGVRGTDK